MVLNCRETTNFSTPSRLKVAKETIFYRVATNYLPILSHQQLLYINALYLYNLFVDKEWIIINILCSRTIVCYRIIERDPRFNNFWKTTKVLIPICCHQFVFSSCNVYIQECQLLQQMIYFVGYVLWSWFILLRVNFFRLYDESTIKMLLMRVV